MSGISFKNLVIRYRKIYDNLLPELFWCCCCFGKILKHIEAEKKIKNCFLSQRTVNLQYTANNNKS